MSTGIEYGRRYARFVLRHRWMVIIVLFASTIFSAFFLDKINLRNDPDSLLPLSNQYIATNLYSERVYGMGNIMVWGVKVKDGDIYQPWFLEMLGELYERTGKLDYANPENFVGLHSSKLRYLGVSPEGNLDFKRLIPANGFSKDPVVRQQQIAYLKDGLEKHPVMEALLTYYEDAEGNKCSLLDDNGQLSNQSVAFVRQHCQAKATFILGDFKNGLKDEPLTWIARTEALMEDFEARYGDRVEFLISGEPYFLTLMLQEIRDKAWLFGISLLIIILVLYYEFRHWSCAILPLLGVGMTIVMTLGLMGITQFKLTTMMVLTPVLLLAIGIGHSMQITRRYMQELAASGDHEKAAEEAIAHTIVPAALSIGTDLHGFFAISFVDISFYKAYAYFGIFGMSTLILTTTTLIPLLMVTMPPKISGQEGERGWESWLGNKLTALLTGPWKWLPVAAVIAVLWVSAHYAELGRGVSAVLAGEAGRSDPEVARIQDEFDIMPGAEKGINYPRAAFKDHYLLGEWFGESGEVTAIADIEKLSSMMPGVITANLLVRSRAGALPPCGLDSRDQDWNRIIGPDECFDELEDPPQGIYNDVEVLHALSELERWLRNHPNIGYTASYIQFVKTINMMLNTPGGQEPMQHMNLYAVPTVAHMRENFYAYRDPYDPDYLPDPNTAIPAYNGMLVANSGAGELDTFVNTRNWDEGTIVAFLNTMDPVKAHQTVLDIQQYLADHAEDTGMEKIRFGIEGGETITTDLDGVHTEIVTEDHLDGKASIGG
ncbi:MAG: MMPL family transporter, partial [bacterium]